MSWQTSKPRLCKSLSEVKTKCVRCPPCYNRVDEFLVGQRSIQLPKEHKPPRQRTNLFSGNFLVGRERTMQTKLVSLCHVEQLCVSMTAGSLIFQRHSKPVSGYYAGFSYFTFRLFCFLSLPFSLSIQPLTAFAILSYGKRDFAKAELEGRKTEIRERCKRRRRGGGRGKKFHTGPERRNLAK